jgi:hypothetical protein
VAKVGSRLELYSVVLTWKIVEFVILTSMSTVLGMYALFGGLSRMMIGPGGAVTVIDLESSYTLSYIHCICAWGRSDQTVFVIYVSSS